MYQITKKKDRYFVENTMRVAGSHTKKADAVKQRRELNSELRDSVSDVKVNVHLDIEKDIITEDVVHNI